MLASEISSQLCGFQQTGQQSSTAVEQKENGGEEEEEECGQTARKNLRRKRK